MNRYCELTCILGVTTDPLGNTIVNEQGPGYLRGGEWTANSIRKLNKFAILGNGQDV